MLLDKKTKTSYIKLFYISFIVINALKLTSIQWLITRSDYSSMLVFVKNLLFLFFFWRIVFLVKHRFVFLVSALIQTVYLIIHNTYYIYVEHTLTLSQIIYSFSEGLTSIRSAFAIMNNPWLYLPMLDLVLIIFIFHFYPLVREKVNRKPFIEIPVLVISVLVVFFQFGYFTEDLSDLSTKFKNFKFGTIFAQTYDLSRDQQDFIDKIEYGESLLKNTNEKQFNLVTIQVESLNADLIGYTHNGSEITPFLNKISRENIYYPYLLSQHKSGGSSDAEFSIFNSVEAISGFPASNFTIYDYPNSFVKRMEKRNCYSFHGNNGDFFNRNINLEKMGFTKFWDRKKMKLDEVGWGAPDEDVYNFMLNRMAEETDSFYYHIITMTSHGPFSNAGNYYNNDNYSDIEAGNERNYLNSISYVDRTLEDFVKKVIENNPDTYIFVYGDHTVKIEGDNYTSNVRYKVDDSLFEYVPLIIITPDRKKYKETVDVVSFLDIAPTVLSASGEQFELKTFGENLITDKKIIFNKEILLNGEFYSRALLFNKISALQNPNKKLLTAK